MIIQAVHVVAAVKVLRDAVKVLRDVVKENAVENAVGRVVIAVTYVLGVVMDEMRVSFS